MDNHDGAVEIPRPRLIRWLFATLLILLSWVIVGSALTGSAAKIFEIDIDALAGNDEASRALVSGYPPWQAATTILVSFAPLLFATIALHRYFLKRPLRQLFTRSDRKLSGEVRTGAVAMVIILLASAMPDLLFNSESYQWNFRLSAFLPYLLIALTLIPIQTSAEEVFFRGWIQQRLENGRRSIWVVSLLGGALFALPHLSNPEVKGEFFFAALGYGASGFMFSWVSMRDRSIGVALGAHAANNIMASLFVTSSDSALPSVSVFTTPAVNWVPAAILSIVTIPIFIWLTKRLSRAKS
jgi:membrane protease YdiL (CAAX protease family)